VNNPYLSDNAAAVLNEIQEKQRQAVQRVLETNGETSTISLNAETSPAPPPIRPRNHRRRTTTSTHVFLIIRNIISFLNHPELCSDPVPVSPAFLLEDFVTPKLFASIDPDQKRLARRQAEHEDMQMGGITPARVVHQRNENAETMDVVSETVFITDVTDSRGKSNYIYLCTFLSMLWMVHRSREIVERRQYGRRKQVSALPECRRSCGLARLFRFPGFHNCLLADLPALQNWQSEILDPV